MSFPRPIEWEIRGNVLVSGRPTDSTLGTGVGRTEQEAISHWRQLRPEWREKASCVHAIPAPIFRTRSLLLVAVCAMAASASLAGFASPTGGPSWASDEQHTRVKDTPRPQASVGAGAIFDIFTEQSPGVAPREDTDAAHRQQENTCANTRQRPVSVEAPPLNSQVMAQALNGQLGGPVAPTTFSPAVGGNQTDLRAQRGLRKETGLWVAIPACPGLAVYRPSHALVGCVQSTLEAPDSAQAGGRPAPLSTPGAPRESLRTPHCPPVRT